MRTRLASATAATTASARAWLHPRRVPGGEPGDEILDHGRLVSLDVLRGVFVAGMLLVEQLPGDAGSTWLWLRHAPWNGWTGADLVFPGFLFVVGASLSYTLRCGWSVELGRRLVKRFVALVVLGLLFNAWAGPGPRFNALRYPGVLQRIAVAGLVASVLVLVLRRWWLVLVAAVVSLAVYGAVLTHASTACGHGTLLPSCNIAGEIDRHVFHAAHLYRAGEVGYDPEGLLSTLGAIATVLAGWLAADAVRTHRRSWWTVAALAVGAVVSFVASGHLWQSTPINKRLWTPPFTLFTAAVFLAVFAVAFVLVDLFHDRPRIGVVGRVVAWPWAVLGRNALVVYVGQHVVGAVMGATAVHHDGRVVPASTWLLDAVVRDHWSGDAALLAYAIVILLLWWVVAAVLHALRWHVTV